MIIVKHTDMVPGFRVKLMGQVVRLRYITRKDGDIGFHFDSGLTDCLPAIHLNVKQDDDWLFEVVG